MKNVDHSRVFLFKSKRLNNYIVSLECRNINKGIVSIVISEYIWKWRLAYFTLELSPINTCKMGCYLPVFFCFKPTFQTLKMNKFYSTSTKTNLKQRIFNAKNIVPTKSTIRIRLRSYAYMLFIFISLWY